MKTNKKIISLVEHGFKPSTLLKLNENQINALYVRLLEQAGPQNTTATQKTIKTYTVTPGAKTMINGVEIDTSGGKTKVTPMGEEENEEMKEEMDFLKGKKKKEVKEKSVSKQQQKFMGLAYSVKKGDTPKSEVSKDIKKAAEGMSQKELKKFAKTKHKDLPKKKETKENYMEMVGRGLQNKFRLGLDGVTPGINWQASVKENVQNMVDKHITPKISKKDFINYIREMAKDSDTKEAPTKPTTKPTTKPKKDPKPDTPYRPKPGPEKAPKAKKHETKEATETAPVKPKPATKPFTKPGTKPSPRPDTPYRPKPGPEKAPKAGRRDLPDWLSYGSIGLDIK